MRLDMQVRRRGEGYVGSLTRVSDQLRAPFTGVLELLAVLEKLVTDEDDEQNDNEGR